MLFLPVVFSNNVCYSGHFEQVAKLGTHDHIVSSCQYSFMFHFEMQVFVFDQFPLVRGWAEAKGQIERKQSVSATTVGLGDAIDLVPVTLVSYGEKRLIASH